MAHEQKSITLSRDQHDLLDSILKTDLNVIIFYLDDDKQKIDTEQSKWDQIEELTIKCLRLSQYLQASTDLSQKENFVSSQALKVL